VQWFFFTLNSVFYLTWIKFGFLYPKSTFFSMKLLGIDIGTDNFAWCNAEYDTGSDQVTVERIGVEDWGEPPLSDQVSKAVEWLTATVGDAKDDFSIVCEGQVPRATNNYAISYGLFGASLVAKFNFQFMASVTKFKLHQKDLKKILTPFKTLKSEALKKRKTKTMKLCSIARMAELMDAKRVPWFHIPEHIVSEYHSSKKQDDLADAIVEVFAVADEMIMKQKKLTPKNKKPLTQTHLPKKK